MIKAEAELKNYLENTLDNHVHGYSKIESNDPRLTWEIERDVIALLAEYYYNRSVTVEDKDVWWVAENRIELDSLVVS